MRLSMLAQSRPCVEPRTHHRRLFHKGDDLVMELFNLYTRLAFGATMTVAVLCVLLEQIAAVL